MFSDELNLRELLKTIQYSHTGIQTIMCVCVLVYFDVLLLLYKKQKLKETKRFGLSYACTFKGQDSIGQCLYRDILILFSLVVSFIPERVTNMYVSMDIDKVSMSKMHIPVYRYACICNLIMKIHTDAVVRWKIDTKNEES